jgi:hypothetical protein
LLADVTDFFARLAVTRFERPMTEFSAHINSKQPTAANLRVRADSIPAKSIV